MSNDLKMLLMGPPKAGKSWLGTTTPTPRLIIDMEGRAKYTPAGKQATFWNGEDEPLKLKKSPSSTYILETTDLAVLDTARQWLRSGQHPWVSLTLDSVMELKYQVKQSKHPGAAQPSRSDWGPINITFEDNLRDLRDLTTKPGKLRCVVFITGASLEIESGKIQPIIKGTIGTLVPYWMDVVGYLEATGSKGMVNPTRKLHLRQRPENDLEVGDGTDMIVDKLGSPIIDASIIDLFEAIQPEGDTND